MKGLLIAFVGHKSKINSKIDTLDSSEMIDDINNKKEGKELVNRLLELRKELVIFIQVANSHSLLWKKLSKKADISFIIKGRTKTITRTHTKYVNQESGYSEGGGHGGYF